MAFSLRNNKNIKTYGSYKVISNDVLCKEDIDALKGTEVVEGQHGLSLCFTYITGETQFVTVDKDMNAKLGDTPDPNNIHILTLQKGAEIIYRAIY